MALNCPVDISWGYSPDKEWTTARKIMSAHPTTTARDGEDGKVSATSSDDTLIFPSKPTKGEADDELEELDDFFASLE